MRKFIFLILLLAGCAKAPLEKPVESTCGTIHKPADGCPNGWVESPNIFTEKNGAKMSACEAPADANLERCIDYLSPGESVELPGPVIIPETPKKDPHA